MPRLKPHKLTHCEPAKTSPSPRGQSAWIVTSHRGKESSSNTKSVNEGHDRIYCILPTVIRVAYWDE
jgi:hypothetical protein